MAQRVIQLLRSSTVYASKEAAITAVKAMTGTDGEIRIARYFGPEYTKNDEAKKDVKDLLCVYHTTTDSTTGKENDPGWTFIEDASDIADILSGLDGNINATAPLSPATDPTATDDNKVVTAVLEVNGLVTGAASNITGVKLAGYAEASSVADIATTDTLGQALGKLQKSIHEMDLTSTGGSGKVITTVAQADGVVTASESDVTDVVMGGYSKTSDTGAIASTDTIEQAFSKVENAIASNAVVEDDGSVSIDTTGGNKALSVNVDGTTIVKDGTSGAISANLTLTQLTSAEVTALSDANVKEAYKLIYATDSNRTAIGNVVKIYKDSALKEVYLGSNQDTIDASTGVITKVTVEDPQSMNFAYQLADGTYSLTKIDVSKFLTQSEFGDGLQVSGAGVVSVKAGNGLEFGSESGENKSLKVKIDANSEKDSQSTPVDFLTVTSTGVKVQGIKDEIVRKINALDVTTDTAVAGQYVAAIQETDGLVAVKARANVSDAVLTGYDKGSSAPASTDVTASDDVKGAIAKLEWQVDDAKSAASAAHSVVEHNSGNTHVTVSSSQDAQTGATTYTIYEFDIASDNDLTNEIAARKAVDGQDGDNYQANDHVTYISNATSLNNADVLLDGAIKANADAINALDKSASVVDGQVVTTVTQEDGLVSETKANLSGITLAGFTTDTSTTGAIVAADTVASALNKLQNKADASLNSVSGSDAITVGNKNVNKDQQISLKLDSATTNVLTITSGEGLYLSEVWDCGTFA